MDISIPAICERLRSQDNRATAGPIFLVQKKVRDYGYDPDYSDNIAWLIDGEGEEVDALQSSSLETVYQSTGEESDGYTRTAYLDRWEFVTCCFTEQGCKDYLSLNAHNLPETRIYVDSAFRNNEFMAVRDFLKNQP